MARRSHLNHKVGGKSFPKHAFQRKRSCIFHAVFLLSPKTVMEQSAQHIAAVTKGKEELSLPQAFSDVTLWESWLDLRELWSGSLPSSANSCSDCSGSGDQLAFLGGIATEGQRLQRVATASAPPSHGQSHSGQSHSGQRQKCVAVAAWNGFGEQQAA